MLRYPYSVVFKSIDGWLATVALLYGASAMITGIALAEESGRYVVVFGRDGRILGFLFSAAATGYVGWIVWRVSGSWRAKVVMIACSVAFLSALIFYLWSNLSS